MLRLPAYNVYEGQSLYDVAIVSYGNASMAMAIANYNGLSVTATLVAGQQIELPDAAKNVQVMQVYKNTGAIPATSTQKGTIMYGGIGYMGLGINFKIS